MTARIGKIRLHDTKVLLWEEEVDEAGMRLVYDSVLGRLRFRGFKIRRDPDVVKRWKSLAPFNHVGQKGHIELHSHTGGRMAEFELFQSVARPAQPHPVSARYDHFPLSRFPRDLRLRFIVELTKLIEKLLEYGYALGKEFDQGEPLYREVTRLSEYHAYEDPLREFNRHWGADRFDRGPDGWPSEKEYSHWAHKDRHGVPVHSGDVRTTRVKGRLFVGRAHPQINGAWSLTSNGTTVMSHPNQFFSCERPDLEPRRFFPDQVDRLRRELERELKQKNYQRVSQMAAALARLEPRPAVAAE